MQPKRFIKIKVKAFWLGEFKALNHVTTSLDFLTANWSPSISGKFFVQKEALESTPIGWISSSEHTGCAETLPCHSKTLMKIPGFPGKF